jgi:PadR family transcriptional regulator PadR
MNKGTEALLERWEQNYKKGLLSFWILLAIAEEALYAYEMREKVEALSKGSISADENSIYRALRRFAKSGLVRSEMRPSEIGPDRRYFQLTKKGVELLAAFIQRNLDVFNNRDVKRAMKKIADQGKEQGDKT